MSADSITFPTTNLFVNVPNISGEALRISRIGATHTVGGLTILDLHVEADLDKFAQSSGRLVALFQKENDLWSLRAEESAENTRIYLGQLEPRESSFCLYADSDNDTTLIHEHQTTRKVLQKFDIAGAIGERDQDDLKLHFLEKSFEFAYGPGEIVVNCIRSWRANRSCGDSCLWSVECSGLCGTCGWTFSCKSNL